MESRAIGNCAESFSTKISTELLKTFTEHSYFSAVAGDVWLGNCSRGKISGD